jgi:outer membrane lipoprotein-sorting protein
MSIFLLIAFLFGANPDPKAKLLLDKVHKLYEQANSLNIHFRYSQTHSDIAGLNKNGELISKGAKFKLILDELDIYCDGTTQYTYLKKNKEVQITEPNAGENSYHPKHIADIYLSGTHDYAISKKLKEGGIPLIIVEFKPKDKKDPVSSIRLYIEEKNNQIKKVQWTQRDGDKTLVQFTKTQFDKVLSDSLFVPDLKSFKGIHIEDLRD